MQSCPERADIAAVAAANCGSSSLSMSSSSSSLPLHPVGAPTTCPTASQVGTLPVSQERASSCLSCLEVARTSDKTSYMACLLLSCVIATLRSCAARLAGWLETLLFTAVHLLSSQHGHPAIYIRNWVLQGCRLPAGYIMSLIHSFMFHLYRKIKRDHVTAGQQFGHFIFN